MMNSLELEALAAAAARRRKLDQEILKKQIKQEELEVTGVSRSGRVRKKSSKLMDFESPDDIEPRFRRQPPPQQSTPLSAGSRPPAVYRGPEHEVAYHAASNGRPHDASGSDTDPYENHTDNPDSMEWESSGSEEGAPGTARAAPAASTPAHHSLYMMEKSNKKKAVVKEGRVVGRAKAQRKDKGQRKTRITAYMLWARGARHELIKNYPDMDFSAISKRLGEMWANVNFQERHMWKRKAKRYSMKADEQQQPANKIISNAAPARQWTSTPTSRPPPRAPPKPQPSPVTPAQHQTSGSGGGGAGVYRASGCGAADVASHLRLLGESLALIGERLMEHEGQIAVSGSVSVLLDTLLCSLAPLICVTRAVPAIAPPVSLLQDTLDNIAYIMPGL